MESKDRELALIEYQIISQDLQNSFNEAPISERWLIVSCGAYWAWFLSDSPITNICIKGFLSATPLLISILFLIRYSAYKKKQTLIGKYRTQLESWLYQSEEYGWERYYYKTKKQRLFKVYTCVYWLCILLANSVFGVIAFLFKTT